MFTSGKFTNHSVCKTCIKALLDSGVYHNNVAQLSGHNSLKSLDSYSVTSLEQQRQMSKTFYIQSIIKHNDLIPIVLEVIVWPFSYLVILVDIITFIVKRPIPPFGE